MVRDAADILLSCYELGVERDAGCSERIYTALDEVGTVVLSRKKEITSRIMRDNVRAHRRAGGSQFKSTIGFDR